jgi:DNA-binding response OmpR family regulator
MQQSILIIDDDESLTGAMAEALTDVGYSVICSGTSAEGLLLAQMHQPDVILCDVVLPDAVGFDTVSALRAHPATCQVPVVLITGDDDASRYEGESKRLMLIKPFSVEILVEVVRGTLAARSPAHH